MIRQSFADTMLEVGKTDPKLVVLIGDISHNLLQPFANNQKSSSYSCPHQFPKTP